jgi:uncharacterized protein
MSMRPYNCTTFVRVLNVAALALVARTPAAKGQLARADSSAQVSFPSSRVHEFTSQINGQPYALFVVLPFNYDSKPNVRYPVLYLLDGGITLAPAVGTYRMQNRAIDSLIMVGIGYLDPQAGPRYRGINFSLPLIAQADSSWRANEKAGRCCQADKTIRVLQEEIIPLVERSYRVTDDRGILGISWSAVFAAWVLFSKPELFNRYAITSPSPWSDNYSLFAAEAAYAEHHDSLPKHVFISVGEFEGSWNKFSADRLTATLAARNYKGLDLVAVTLPDAFHNSASQYSEVFRALYPPRAYISAISDTATLNAASAVVRKYLRAYETRDLSALATTLADSAGFEAVFNGELVKGRNAYLAAIKKTGTRKLPVFPLNGYGVSTDLRRTIFFADSPVTAHNALAPRAIWVEQVRGTPQISYTLHNNRKEIQRRLLVKVDHDGKPVAGAQVVAIRFEGGVFASARTDASGTTSLGYDWDRDWPRSGYIEVRAAGFKPVRLAPPSRDTSYAVHLK